MSIPDSPPLDKPLVIATRASRLAVWQAEHVRDLLMARYPGLEVTLLKLSTRGDEILDRSLQKVGGKGLFIKELEMALEDGRADLAVHSLKDVPVDMPDGFSLCAILPRAVPFDAWVSSAYADLQSMPAGAVVGTSSLRRQAQILRVRPDLIIKPLRGNVNTRLRKLDDGEFDAIVLATAGLERLELSDRIRSVMPAELSLPAAGQGSLGIEICEGRDDLAKWLMPLSCSQSTACSLAERAVSRSLGGSCSVPLAAFAQIDENNPTEIWVRGLVASPDGQELLEAQARGSVDNAQALGEQVAQELLKAGADRILAELLQAD